MKRVLFIGLALIIAILTCGCFADSEEPDEYIGDFVIADYKKYRNGDYHDNVSSVEAYVTGTITSIKNNSDIYIKDTDENVWWLHLYGAEYDFSEYVGTECEVYGNLFYQDSYNLKPMLGIVNGDHRIVFCDGKEYYSHGENADKSVFPTIPEVTYPEVTTTVRKNEVDTVWITSSGTKYHEYQGCSGMENPIEISREEAEARGYEPCKRCR